MLKLATCTLRTLTVGFNDAWPFALALSKNSSLTAVSCRLDGLSGDELGTVLKHNTTITTVDLFAKETVNFARGLTVLRLNTPLTALDLSGNALDVEGGVRLAEALRANTHLVSLKLRDCRLTVTDESVADHTALAALYQVLKQPSCSIQTLSLAGNDLANDADGNGASALAETLYYNTSITELSLAKCFVSLQGLTGSASRKVHEAIAKVLTSNSSLTSLDLSENNLGSCGGGKIVGEALRHNRTLRSLNVRSNWLGAEGGKAVVDALAANASLTFLDLGTNALCEDSATSRYSTAALDALFALLKLLPAESKLQVRLQFEEKEKIRKATLVALMREAASGRIRVDVSHW